LREDGRHGLKDGVVDEVAVGGLSFPVGDDVIIPSYLNKSYLCSSKRPWKS
jgi:hypothetical protein